MSFNFVLNLKIFASIETQTEHSEEFVQSISVHDGNLESSRSFSASTSMPANESLSICHEHEQTLIEELKLNLKVKENIIDSINDTLVLREAEIARLKTRIALMERKSLINEINENN